jgi:hypothetical protein
MSRLPQKIDKFHSDTNAVMVASNGDIQGHRKGYNFIRASQIIPKRTTSKRETAQDGIDNKERGVTPPVFVGVRRFAFDFSLSFS